MTPLRAVIGIVAAVALPAGAARRATDLDMAGQILGLRTGDVNGDKLLDLVVALETQRTEERSKTLEKDGQYILTVESVEVHERVARVFLQGKNGEIDPHPRTVMVEPSALAMDVADTDGDGRAEILFLMPDGIDAFDLDDEGSPHGPRRLASTRSILSDATGFPGELRLAWDLDGDGFPELCVPAIGELAIFWNAAGSFGADVTRLPLPAISRGSRGGLSFAQALPTFVDANGDGRKDVVVVLDRGEVFAWVQKRRGEFAKTPIHGAWPTKGKGWSRRLVTARDLDGDGRLDVVAERSKDIGRNETPEGESEEAGGTSDHVVLEIFRGAEDLSLPATASATIDVGETKKGESPGWCLVRDLDGDGVSEIMPVILRVSTFQLLKAAISRSITVGVRMPVFRRKDADHYEIAETLEGEIDVSLKHLSLAYLLSVDGDLDGDGVKDLVEPKGAAGLSVRRGKRGGTFDNGVLEKLSSGQGEDLVGALQIQDLNGDRKDDVLVIRESWKKDRLLVRILISQPEIAAP